VIRLEQLHKRYGGRLAVAPLTLEVAAGEVVALVGPNGAGKSTTLRAIAGIISPTGGRASVAGHDVESDGVAARRQTGYLSQRLGVPLSAVVGHLARLVAELRGVPPAQALEAIEGAGLGDRLHASLGELSGGQRQRVMLALATLGPVTALLLDEPGISLDSEGSEEVRHAIRAASKRGAAVLFASHHLQDVALLADRIMVMVEGWVVAQGTLSQLAAAAGVALDPAVKAEAPIDRIYRILVTRERAAIGRQLTLVRGAA
jgi:ABC-type multidrug transport system ATPase subunit